MANNYGSTSDSGYSYDPWTYGVDNASKASREVLLNGKAIGTEHVQSSHRGEIITVSGLPSGTPDSVYQHDLPSFGGGASKPMPQQLPNVASTPVSDSTGDNGNTPPMSPRGLVTPDNQPIPAASPAPALNSEAKSALDGGAIPATPATPGAPATPSTPATPAIPPSAPGVSAEVKSALEGGGNPAASIAPASSAPSELNPAAKAALDGGDYPAAYKGGTVVKQGIVEEGKNKGEAFTVTKMPSGAQVEQVAGHTAYRTKDPAAMPAPEISSPAGDQLRRGAIVGTPPLAASAAPNDLSTSAKSALDGGAPPVSSAAPEVLSTSAKSALDGGSVPAPAAPAAASPATTEVLSTSAKSALDGAAAVPSSSSVSSAAGQTQDPTTVTTSDGVTELDKPSGSMPSAITQTKTLNNAPSVHHPGMYF